MSISAHAIKVGQLSYVAIMPTADLASATVPKVVPDRSLMLGRLEAQRLLGQLQRALDEAFSEGERDG